MGRKYKARFGLPHDYPSVAAEYSVSRRKIAIDAGLGRKIEGSADRDVWPATSDATPRRRGRPRKVPR
ncbi:MucR family transcriptional regulator [Methylobacterium indicum]|uniref:Transcriptional regulator n=1 Tax=Methylobacterium indicum TaxID=1775910 RepID=A0A8H8X0K1_9HYPH|nr:MucR family transcriptional regulator [Methylobacterium indicum]BCM87667.1 hypothetical protein mvi_61280 [Methylobacterium indicum]